MQKKIYKKRQGKIEKLLTKLIQLGKQMLMKDWLEISSICVLDQNTKLK